MDGTRANPGAEHEPREEREDRGTRQVPHSFPRQSRNALASLVVLGGLTGLLIAACSSPASSTRGSVNGAAPAVVETRSKDWEATSEAWTFEGREGKLITTPSFRIFTTLPTGNTTRRLPRFLEDAIDHYTTTLGVLPRPTSPLETYIMETRGQWSTLTQRVMGEEAGVYLRIQRGGFSARGRALLFFIGQRDTLAIAAHEGWHQYTQSVFKDTLPAWLDEGVATYMEGFRFDKDDPTRVVFKPWANAERFDKLQSALSRGKLIPLERVLFSTPQDLISSDSDSALTYYAQVWALVHFLEVGERGKYKGALGAMLGDAASGKLVDRVRRSAGSRAASTLANRRRGSDALTIYCGEDLATLSRQYEAFVASLVKLGNKQKIVAGEAPVLE